MKFEAWMEEDRLEELKRDRALCSQVREKYERLGLWEHAERQSQRAREEHRRQWLKLLGVTALVCISSLIFLDGFMSGAVFVAAIVIGGYFSHQYESHEPDYVSMADPRNDGEKIMEAELVRRENDTLFDRQRWLLVHGYDDVLDDVRRRGSDIIDEAARRTWDAAKTYVADERRESVVGSAAIGNSDIHFCISVSRKSSIEHIYNDAFLVGSFAVVISMYALAGGEWGPVIFDVENDDVHRSFEYDGCEFIEDMVQRNPNVVEVAIDHLIRCAKSGQGTAA